MKKQMLCLAVIVSEITWKFVTVWLYEDYNWHMGPIRGLKSNKKIHV